MGGVGSLLTIGLRVIDRLFILHVLVQVRLLLAVTLSAVWSEFLLLLNCPQALLQLLTVIADGPLVVCTAWFSFKTLDKSYGNS